MATKNEKVYQAGNDKANTLFRELFVEAYEKKRKKQGTGKPKNVRKRAA